MAHELSEEKRELFETMPIPKAVATLAIPTIISMLVNLLYNMVDAFFIGRTGNSYMLAATTLTMTMTFLCVAFSNLFGLAFDSRLLPGRDVFSPDTRPLVFWNNLSFVPRCPKSIYKLQLEAMEKYLAILEARAAIEEVPVWDCTAE